MSYQAPPEEVDKMEALRTMSLLREFTEVGLRILADAVEQKSVGRGTYAFRGGDHSEALSFIAKGTLQLVPRDGGNPLGEITAGDTLGGFSLLVSGEHLLSAMAVNDVELLQLSHHAFEQLKKSHPRTALKLTVALAQDLVERLREAKGPLREFLVWQVAKRQA
jgi:CRP-like cAMP-binding protein